MDNIRMDDYQKRAAIIQSGRSIDQYPYEAIAPDLLDAMMTALESVTPASAKAAKPVLKIFECFLQITGKQLSLRDLQKATFAPIYKSFIGALYSTSFLEATRLRRYTYAHGFRRLIDELRNTLPKIPSIQASLPSSERGLGKVDEFVALFDSREKDAERMQMWQGWPIENRAGRVTQLPFFDIYRRLGSEFTSRLHQACSEYFSARKCQRVIGMNELATFIKEHPVPLSTSDFQSPAFTLDFWKRFLLF